VSAHHLLSNALGEVWADADHLIDGDLAGFEAEALTALRAMESAASAGDTAEADRAAETLTHLVATQPALDQRFTAELVRLGADAARDLLEASPADRCITFPVMFATDRASHRRGEHTLFTATRGPLQWGQASMSVPDDHRLGDIEKPRWWRLQFRRRPDRHVVADTVTPLETGAAQTRIGDLIGRGERRAAVFIHGYNTDFDAALSRTAQLAFDLQYPGLIVCFAWPSTGALTGYPADEDEAALSAETLRTVLTTLTGLVGPGNVSVVAHSMGCRILTDALTRTAATTVAPPPVFDQIALAAPDVEVELFRRRVTAFHPLVGRTTLYASSADKALQASLRFHRHRRAGQAGPDLLVMPGLLDSIDATAMSTDFLAHSYFGDHSSVVGDLFSLLRHGHGPEQRYGLRRHDQWWEMVPSAH
jgi:esterase/lipase superfamily enzyme